MDNAYVNIQFYGEIMKDKKALFIITLISFVIFVFSRLNESVYIRASHVILISLFTAFYLVYLGNQKRAFRPIKSLLYLNMIMAIIISLYASIYHDLGIVEDFTTALYFSVTTWTTLGIGDIAPTGVSRFFTASQALIGHIYMGIVVAQLFHLISPKSTLV